jgi:hypothetical protein
MILYIFWGYSMKKILLTSLAFLFAVAGTQALPLRYISLEPIEVATSKWDIAKVLRLIDGKQFTSGTSYIGKIISYSMFGPTYIITGIGFWEDCQNQALKHVKILVASGSSICKGDKIYADGEDSWYEVTDVACNSDDTGNLEIRLTQRTI